eukprot:UN24942
MQLLEASLEWSDMMRNGWADPNKIDVQESTVTLNTRNDGSGENVEHATWEVYMVADIETWAGYVQVSDLKDDALNWDFNNPDSNGNNLDWTNHLTNDQGVHSFYSIPFLLSFPQEIEIVETYGTQTFGRMVSLFAIVQQQTVNINFDPDLTGGERFGHAEVVLRTQTQYPFALYSYTETTN